MTDTPTPDSRYGKKFAQEIDRLRAKYADVPAEKMPLVMTVQELMYLSSLMGESPFTPYKAVDAPP